MKIEVRRTDAGLSDSGKASRCMTRLYVYHSDASMHLNRKLMQAFFKRHRYLLNDSKKKIATLTLKTEASLIRSR